MIVIGTGVSFHRAKSKVRRQRTATVPVVWTVSGENKLRLVAG
jgi:hypothetical protein